MGVVGAALAGCTTLAGETELTEPTESHDGHSVRFAYDHDDETLVRVSFNKRPDTPWRSPNEIPESPAFHRLRVGVETPSDGRLDDYRFRFEPARDTAANVYLHPPELGHEDAFDTYRDADWTVIEAEYDGGTPVGTGFELLVHSDSESADDSVPIRADHELTLSGDGALDETFVARDRTVIDLERTA